MYLSKIDFTEDSYSKYADTDYLPIFVTIDNDGYRFTSNPQEITENWCSAIELIESTVYSKCRMCQFKVNSIINASVFNALSIPPFSDNSHCYQKGNGSIYSTYAQFAENRFTPVYSSRFLNRNLQSLQKYFVNNTKKTIRMWLIKLSDLKRYPIATEKEISTLEQTFKEENNGTVDERLSEFDKLSNYIYGQWDDVELLGDIYLSKQQEDLLFDYLKEEFATNHFHKLDKINPFFFSLGMVRFAMHYYNKHGNGGFWLYFKDVFGQSIEGNKQKTFRDELTSAFYYTKKLYTDKKYYDYVMDIDDINMHAFVCDQAANGLFDNLFDFWRHDMQRCLDPTDSCYDDAFDNLISLIKNHPLSIPTHTARVINCEATKDYGKNIIRELLKLMADSFWSDNFTIPKENNRLYTLLDSWKENPENSFQKEFDYKIKGKYSRGKTALRSPSLRLIMKDDKPYVSYVFQLMRLPGITELTSQPKIQISNGSETFIIEDEVVRPHLQHDGLGQYIESFQWDGFPRDFLYSKIETKVIYEGKEIKTYSIPESPMRFFDDNEYLINHMKNPLSEGRVYTVSPTNKYPFVQNKYPDQTLFNQDCFNTWDISDGDIFRIDENIRLIVGLKTRDGLFDNHPVSHVFIVKTFEDKATKEYPIYNSLPGLCIKASSGLNGALLRINKSNYNIDDAEKGNLLGDTENDYYFVNIGDYIKTPGFYDIELSLKSGYVRDVLHCFYNKSFDYQFKNAPYLFQNEGSLVYDKNLPIKLENSNQDDSITISSCGETNILTFTYGYRASDSNSNCVNGQQIHLQYRYNGVDYPLIFDIPALFWNFDGHETWLAEQPNEITLKQCQRFYVKSSFNLNGAFLFTPDDIPLAAVDNHIHLSVDQEGNSYFDLSIPKSWFEENSAKYAVGTLNLHLPKPQTDFKLLSVITRGVFQYLSIYVEDKCKIHARVSIHGNDDYFVDIEDNKKEIVTELLIKNDEFVFEVPENCLNHFFDFNFYSKIAADSGDPFDEETKIPVTQKPIRMRPFDPNSLEQKTLQIHFFQDLEKKTAHHPFKDYFLKNLKIREAPDEESFYGFFDSSHQDSMADFQYYSADLYLEKNPTPLLTDVLVIVTRPCDFDSIYMFGKESDGNYGTFLYNKADRSIVNPRTFMTLPPNEKRKLLLVRDEDYYFHLTIKEN